ncbi:DUF4433 domain-containing protein [candidate division KSB1 bacterium]|nr:MAG: DUF4433 domain-containing protein [candidate division KSB1 bacterium]
MLFRAHTVKGEARRRGVQLLLHSTHLYKNLPAILSDGMLHTPRSLSTLYGSSASRFLHDPRRYEKFTVGLDYLNCALSFPNVELLYRRSKTGWKHEWIHFALDLLLLDHPDTQFCPISAAADFGKHLQQGKAGFQAMYAERVLDAVRRDQPENVPTHPQAEILVRGPLNLDAAQTIIVPDSAVSDEVVRLCEMHERKIRVEVLPQYFVWPVWMIKDEEK